MSQFELRSVVLAAGKGTRMKSKLPKVLHSIGGKPMLEHVLASAKEAGAEKQLVIVGFGAEEVECQIGPKVDYVQQTEQLGTGHALKQAEEWIRQNEGTVLVLCGDTPLLRAKTLAELVETHKKASAAATVLSAVMPDATGYGRLVRDERGQVIKIVEHKDASPEELAIQEVNTGIYCFEPEPLLAALKQIKSNNAQGEYYLTDVIALLVQQNLPVFAQKAADYEETLGINSRSQLAEGEQILRRRKLTELMAAGVTVMDLGSTFVDQEVQIGADTILYPFTWLEGSTVIGEQCVIGPNTRLTNVEVGQNVTMQFTYGHDCRIDDDVTIGPYVHLRPDTHLQAGVKVGNFVEVKNSTIGKGSKLPHLSYIGDTDMGDHVNMGCGTITVNYDGVHKHRTTIGDDAFVGCNTNLVAPVTVGQGAYVAAGSTITKDVPAEALGVARARQNNLEGWVKRIHNQKKK